MTVAKATYGRPQADSRRRWTREGDDENDTPYMYVVHGACGEGQALMAKTTEKKVG